MPRSLSSSTRILFADDGRIFASSTDINLLIVTINNDIKQLCDWLRVNKLALNVNTTDYIFSLTIFSTSKRPYHVTQDLKIGDTTLERIESKEFLGMYLDSKLDFHRHINHICSQLSKSLFTQD